MSWLLGLGYIAMAAFCGFFIGYGTFVMIYGG